MGSTLKSIFFDTGAGEQLRSASSPMYVLHADSGAGDAGYLDPWTIAAGIASTPHNILEVSGGAFLELIHIWEADNPTSVAASVADVDTITTAPTVAVYGKLRDASPIDDQDPNVANSQFPSLSDWWARLIDPNPPSTATNDYDIDFATATVQQYEAASTSANTNDLYISAPRRVFLAGASKVLVTIKTAASFGIATNASMILGRLVT